MTMKAQISTDAFGNITVHMKGGLDFENTTPFNQELTKICGENPNSTITLDLHGLDFVGSSGISLFVDTVKSINKQKDQIRFMNVKSEFMKVFKLFGMDAIETLLFDFENDDTEHLNQRIGARKRTFQN